jgi:hypothetical protein
VLLVLEPYPRAERHLHQLFAEDRIRGEWFHASRELRAFIASFLQDMATPVAFRNPHSEGPWHPLDPPGTP